MGDVAIYDEELRSLEDEIAACLRAIDTLSGDARVEKCNKAADIIKKIGKTYHQFKYELRLLEGTEQAAYEKKAQEHQQTIQQLKTKLTQKRGESGPASPITPGSPKGGAGGGGDGAGDGRKNDGLDDARVQKNRIAKTQKGTLDSLQRTEEMINQSEDVGNQAATTLKNQTEQIKQANEKLDVIESQVDKAKTELNAFIRRMMTDKIIICFAVLVIVGIIVIVVYKVQSKGDAPAPPPTPRPSTLAPPPVPPGP
jgi:hypothetical protein